MPSSQMAVIMVLAMLQPHATFTLTLVNILIKVDFVEKGGYGNVYVNMTGRTGEQQVRGSTY